jgi:sporulation protein YlmC with PRC-barrel domain
MTRLKLLSSVAVAAFVAMPAFAQTSTSPATSPSANRPAATAPAGSAARQLPSDIQAWKVSDLVGKNVYNSQDEKVGDINDVVTSKSGSQAMAVIGVGGFLGIGEKQAAVPIDQLKVQGDKIVVAGMTKDSLKQQADYKKDEYEKADRDQMVSQLAGPSTSGSSSTGSTGTTGASPSGATGTSGSTSGSSSPSTTGSSGMSGSSSTGSGSASGTSGSSSGTSGSMGSGSTTGTGGSSSGASDSSSGGTSASPAANAPSGGTSTQTPKQ